MKELFLGAADILDELALLSQDDLGRKAKLTATTFRLRAEMYNASSAEYYQKAGQALEQRMETLAKYLPPEKMADVAEQVNAASFALQQAQAASLPVAWTSEDEEYFASILAQYYAHESEDFRAILERLVKLRSLAEANGKTALSAKLLELGRQFGRMFFGSAIPATSTDIDRLRSLRDALQTLLPLRTDLPTASEEEQLLQRFYEVEDTLRVGQGTLIAVLEKME